METRLALLDAALTHLDRPRDQKRVVGDHHGELLPLFGLARLLVVIDLQSASTLLDCLVDVSLVIEDRRESAVAWKQMLLFVDETSGNLCSPLHGGPWAPLSCEWGRHMKLLGLFVVIIVSVPYKSCAASKSDFSEALSDRIVSILPIVAELSLQ